MLFPHDILGFSSEVYKYRFGKTNRTLYNALLFFISIAIVSTFFIKVPVTVQSNGLIKSQSEKTPIYVSTQGRISFINMKENLAVAQGDTLLTIENEITQKQRKSYIIKRKEYEQLMADAQLLCKTSPLFMNFDSDKLHTAFYKQNLLALQQQYFQTQQRYELLQKRFDRLKQLMDERLIPAQEYESTEQELKQVEKEIPLSIQKAKNQWQQEILNYQAQLRDATSNVEQTEQQLQQYVVRAPVSGTIHNYSGVLKNTFVSAGQSLAEISPDSEKVIECFVTPNNIGLIHKNMEVSFQVESFNYNQWGFLKGKVLDISNDVTIPPSNNQGNGSLFFKVRCSMDKKFLSLKNGYKGYLKKGMTVNARFVITERTIMQLLVDKVDNWLRPGVREL